MFTSVHDLIFISGGDEDGAGVTDNKAVKPVTTVKDCVSSFVNLTPLGIYLYQGALAWHDFQLCLWQ